MEDEKGSFFYSFQLPAVWIKNVRETEWTDHSKICSLLFFHEILHHFSLCRTTNKGPMRIQYKCLVLIYVFPEMKLRGLVISKTEFIKFCLPISTFMYLWAIYIFSGSVCLFCCSLYRPWEYTCKFFFTYMYCTHLHNIHSTKSLSASTVTKYKVKFCVQS